VGDGAHFGAEGDWTRDKTEQLGKSLGELIQIAVKQKDDEIEALRAEVSRLEAERAAFRLHHVEACHDLHARAEKAERERDEARVRYCREVAK
jgi:hypothetical protein